MKLVSTTLVLIVWLFSSAVQSQESQLFINANVIDLEKQTTSLRHIEIRDGQIIKLHEQKPNLSQASVVDLNGGFVLPGFIDMHVHSWGNGSMQDNYQWVGTQGTLKASLYSGVYGVLDLFSDEDDIFDYRNQQELSHEAQLFAAGPCITKTDGHCANFGTKTRIVDTPEDALEQVRELAERRPDVVKLVYDSAGFIDGNRAGLDKPSMQALITEARRLNLKTMVHVGTWQDVKDAAEAGATFITHTPMAPMPEDIPELLKAKEVTMVPTLAVQTEWPVALSQSDYFDHPMLQAVTTPELLGDYEFDIDAPRFKRLKAFIDKHQHKDSARHMDHAIAKLAKAEVPILIGSDAGNPIAFHGYTVHREMAQLVEAGLSNWQVLHAATLGAAKKLGVNWSITAGNQANFLVLDASPIADIRHTESIRYLVKQGQILDREVLRQEIIPGFWQTIWMYLTGW